MKQIQILMDPVKGGGALVFMRRQRFCGGPSGSRKPRERGNFYESNQSGKKYRRP